MSRVLETERLRLRPLTFADDAFILKLLNDPSFLMYIGDKEVRTLADARRYMADGPMASHLLHGFGLDCVELKQTGEPAGLCGLLKRPALDDADVGYAFLPEFWSRGYAREAVRSVLKDARQRLRLRQVAAVVDGRNVKSVRLLESLAFRFQRMVALHEGDDEVQLFLHRFDEPPARLSSLSLPPVS